MALYLWSVAAITAAPLGLFAADEDPPAQSDPPATRAAQEPDEEKTVREFNAAAAAAGRQAISKSCDQGNPCVESSPDGKRIYRNLPDAESPIPAEKLNEYYAQHQERARRVAASLEERKLDATGTAAPAVPNAGPVADFRPSTIVGKYEPGKPLTRSADIKRLQPILKQMGMYHGPVDGLHGPGMEAARDRLAQAYNYHHATETEAMARGGTLTAWDRDLIDSIAKDPAEMARLRDAAKSLPAAARPDPIRVGKNGEIVAEPDKGVFAGAQRDLNTLRDDPRFKGSFGQNALTIDNRPRNGTRGDLKAFQAAVGLPATGMLDPETQRKLFAEATRRRISENMITAAPKHPGTTAPGRTASSTTFYPFNVRNIQMEGGPFAFKDGSPIATLEDYLSGRTNHVTVAGYRKHLGSHALAEGLGGAIRNYCASNFCVAERSEPNALVPVWYGDKGASQLDMPTKGRAGLGTWADHQLVRLYAVR